MVKALVEFVVDFLVNAFFLSDVFLNDNFSF